MVNVPTVLANSDCYIFLYPEEVTKTTGLAGFCMPIRELYETVATKAEKNDPKEAAFYREVASHFSHCDNAGHSVDRDGNGAILVDFDDWDELTTAQRVFRGNRNAAIAVLDSLRFRLEMMTDDPDNTKEVDDIRRALRELI